ncbi:hypothetical protein J2W94_002202 [Pseudoxanthomonas sacheonensis]|uniref:Uncharacterized protein n=1 Tax=Pseudoxanthomonas sacheonensis TaxID=443615 RepID=A0ABU1RTI1_9GAMM|nr:hypothetical protein [Pseudoxanthomonas sacheonensis]
MLRSILIFACFDRHKVKIKMDPSIRWDDDGRVVADRIFKVYFTLRSATKDSTTEGSASVEVSPS